MPLGLAPRILAQSGIVKLAQAAQFVFALAVGVGIFSFFRTAQDGELRRSCMSLCETRPQYAGYDRLAPDFELERLNGGRARLSDYGKKTIVLNFWTKSCAPCLEEMPSLARFATTLKARGDAVLVSVCTDDTREEVQATLAKVLPNGVPFDVLLDPEAKVVTGLYGTKLYPETWFIDPEGVIRLRIDGARNYGEALYVDLVGSLTAVPACDIEFKAGQPWGRNGILCAATGK